MKKSCILWMFAMLMLAVGMSSCSSKDEESQDPLSYYCYTGKIRAIHSKNRQVQVVIMESPKMVSDRPIPIKGDEILFADEDLTDSFLQVDNIIEFRIIEYEAFNRVGGVADSPTYYFCKVKPCK